MSQKSQNIHLTVDGNFNFNDIFQVHMVNVTFSFWLSAIAVTVLKLQLDKDGEGRTENRAPLFSLTDNLQMKINDTVYDSLREKRMSSKLGRF